MNMNTNILKAVKKTQIQGSEIQEKEYRKLVLTWIKQIKETETWNEAPQISESCNQTSEERNRKK